MTDTQNTLETAPEVTPKGRTSRKWYLRKRILIPAGVLAFIIIIGSANAKHDPADASDAAPATTQSEAAKAPAKAKPAPVEQVVVPATAGMTSAVATTALIDAGFDVTAPNLDGMVDVVVNSSPAAGTSLPKGAAITITLTEKPKMTLAQENAVEQAQSYLDTMPFSRQGLIDQLSSEYGSGYPVDVATFAVDTISPDWNAEAAEAAKSYLNSMSFSRDGLFEQLTSEFGAQFTPDEANAGLAAVGY